MDKKEGSGSHNWGTFEDEMKAEEDKANTSTDMNESAVEADAKEETAAEPVNTAEDEEAAARRVMIFVPINPRSKCIPNYTLQNFENALPKSPLKFLIKLCSQPIKRA